MASFRRLCSVSLFAGSWSSGVRAVKKPGVVGEQAIEKPGDSEDGRTDQSWFGYWAIFVNMVGELGIFSCTPGLKHV